MAVSHRISVRLGQEQLERVQRHCLETGYDVSRVVRQALDSRLAPDSGSATSGAPKRRLAPPEAIIPLTSRYMAWGDGDLRKHRNRLFAELLAAAFVCKKHYPRTPGMLEGYEGLRQLCLHFGLED